MHIDMYTCTCLYASVCMQKCVCVPVCICVCATMCVCVCCVCMYGEMSRLHTYAGPYLYTSTYLKICVCMCWVLWLWGLGSREGVWALTLWHRKPCHHVIFDPQLTCNPRLLKLRHNLLVNFLVRSLEAPGAWLMGPRGSAVLCQQAQGLQDEKFIC